MHQQVVLDLTAVLEPERLRRARLVLPRIRQLDPLAEDDLDAELLQPSQHLVVDVLLVEREEAVARVDEGDALLRRRRGGEERGVGRVVVEVGNVRGVLDAQSAASGDEDGRGGSDEPLLRLPARARRRVW